jgi:hypothetical protein
MFTIGVLLNAMTIFGQNNNDTEKAEKLLHEAITDVFSSNNVGIYFDAIAYNVQKPEEIFTLPAYKVYKGGFLFVDQKKFQMELGLMKSISDGKLTILIDEQSKTMIVDSVRKQEFQGDDPTITELINDNFKSNTLKYEGETVINNQKCYKIRSVIKGDKDMTEVTYWIRTSNKQLYMMSETKGVKCNVYLFNRVGKAPSGFKYDVYLPQRPLTDYHGYSVIDNRFSLVN